MSSTRVWRRRAQTLGRSDALVAGPLDAFETARFRAWAAYQLALVAVVSAQDFPVQLTWPDEPDDATIRQLVAEEEARKAAEHAAEHAAAHAEAR